MSLANFIPTGDDYLRYLPEIILTVVGTLIMLLEVLMGERPKPVLGWLAGAGMVAAIWGAVVAFAVGGLGFQGMVIVDGFATFFRVLVLVVGLLTFLIYYIVFTASWRLAFSGTLNPSLAPYLADVLFTFVAVYFWVRTLKELPLVPRGWSMQKLLPLRHKPLLRH